MKTPEIRLRFAAQLGDERYRQFLEQFNRRCRKRGRLNFWHEKEWGIFCASNPDCSDLSFSDLIPVFRLCHVHLMELDDASIPIIHGLSCVYEVLGPGAEPRPYSQTYSIDSPAFEGMDELTVERCPECIRGREDQTPDRVRADFAREMDSP